ncbi:MAG: hypothetical protein HZA89_15745, partial [Verrucomicrobia bacterium]|nr:hypothetical protein [Verrucomicrobiota bacterium]
MNPFARPALVLASLCISFSSLPAVAANNVAKRSVTPNAPLDCPPELKFNQPGVKLTLVAEHPQVMTPTGIDVDKEGHVWVVTSHTHFRPPDYPGPKHDEIVVLSNPDATLEDLAQTAAARGVRISPQGLDQRFTMAAAETMRMALEAAAT